MLAFPPRASTYIYIHSIYNFCFPGPSTVPHPPTPQLFLLSKGRVRLPESVRWVGDLHLDLWENSVQQVQPTVFKAGFLMVK